MEIIDNRGAPPELVRLIHEEVEEEDCKCVNRVIFDAFIEDLNGDMGAYDPHTGTIIIDMGSCMMNNAWMKKGMMFIPCVWFNLLMTIFHELTHAVQLELEPELKDLDALPQFYEDEATIVAEKRLINWIWMKEKRGYKPVPTLSEMGWVGEQIKLLLNKLYAEMPESVIEEVDLQGTGIAASAEAAARASKEYSAEEETALLLKQIDEGKVGAKVGDGKYLVAFEAIDLDEVKHYTNRR